MKRELTDKEAQELEEFTKSCYADRRFAVENLCTITNKYGKEIPFKLWEPSQTKVLRIIREANALPEKTTILIPKLRQGGISKICSADRVIESRLYKNVRSLFLIKEEKDTPIFFDDKIKEIDDNLPEEFRGPKTREQSTSLRYEDTGSIIRIHTAGATKAVTEKKGRSNPENYVHVTEAAFIQYLEALIRGVRGALTPNGTLVLESTMNGPRNYFYNLCSDMYNTGIEIEKNVWRKESTWMIFCPYWEHPECVRMAA